MTEIMGKVEERTPFVIVAFQECQRMNYLTNEIKRSLRELDLGLKVRKGNFIIPIKSIKLMICEIRYINKLNLPIKICLVFAISKGG